MEKYLKLAYQENKVLARLLEMSMWDEKYIDKSYLCFSWLDKNNLDMRIEWTIQKL